MFLSVGSEEAAAAARARSESFYLDARDTNSRSTNERTSEPKKECKRFAINFEISIPGIFSPVAASAGDEIREILGVFSAAVERVQLLAERGLIVTGGSRSCIIK